VFLTKSNSLFPTFSTGRFLQLSPRAYNVEHGAETFQKINSIMEPIQITLWGVIEFCLSGAFIIQMWKFQWTAVERKAIFVLVLVACCDIMSVLSNIFIGDLESTTVKGFVYCLRIRLEISVLCEMVEFVKCKRGSVTFGSSTLQQVKGSAGRYANNGSSNKCWERTFCMFHSNRRSQSHTHNAEDDEHPEVTAEDQKADTEEFRNNAKNTTAIRFGSDNETLDLNDPCTEISRDEEQGTSP
jgi:hypothetical protein